MEGQTRSGSRRARFADDRQQSDRTGDDNEIFEKPTIPVLVVLHDTVPDLGSNADSRNLETSSTLANLTDEFNDLTRKMTLLKDTLKVTRNVGAKKMGPMQANSTAQALHVANISDIVSAKRVIFDCIAELTFVNHFLDGNEEAASVYREKMYRAIGTDCGTPEPIVIQGLSVAPINRNLHRKEAAMQTEDSVFSTDKDIVEPHVTVEPIREICQKCQQQEQKKTRKWYSCCGGCRRKKKSKEKPRGKSSKASPSKKSMGKPPEKSCSRVVICDDKP